MQPSTEWYRQNQFAYENIQKVDTDETSREESDMFSHSKLQIVDLWHNKISCVDTQTICHPIKQLKAVQSNNNTKFWLDEPMTLLAWFIEIWVRASLCKYQELKGR